MKRISLIILGIIVLIIVMAAVSGTNKDSSSTSPKAEASSSAEVKKTGVTMEQFNKLENGMSYDQVKEILGEGELSSESSVSGYTSKLYSWKGQAFASNMNATFSNDKLIGKAQFGLK